MSDFDGLQSWQVRLVFWVLAHHPAKFFIDWNNRATVSSLDAIFDGSSPTGRKVKLRDVLPGPQYTFSTDFGPYTDANLRRLLAKWPSGRAPRRLWMDADDEALRASSATPLQPTVQTSIDRCQSPESAGLSDSLSAGLTGPAGPIPQSGQQSGVCE